MSNPPDTATRSTNVAQRQLKTSDAIDAIVNAMADSDKSYAWLARTSGIRYKRLLAELKHRTRPVSLETTLSAAEALNIDLPDLLALAA